MLRHCIGILLTSCGFFCCRCCICSEPITGSAIWQDRISPNEYAMSDRALSSSSYFIVLVILVALTILTVAVSFIPLAPPWHVASGLAIALLKASLVVLFFMHALYSVRLTWIVIVVAVFWLAILFA